MLEATVVVVNTAELAAALPTPLRWRCVAPALTRAPVAHRLEPPDLTVDQVRDRPLGATGGLGKALAAPAAEPLAALLASRH